MKGLSTATFIAGAIFGAALSSLALVRHACEAPHELGDPLREARQVYAQLERSRLSLEAAMAKRRDGGCAGGDGAAKAQPINEAAGVTPLEVLAAEREVLASERAILDAREAAADRRDGEVAGRVAAIVQGLEEDEAAAPRRAVVAAPVMVAPPRTATPRPASCGAVFLLGVLMHVERKAAVYLPRALASIRREYGQPAGHMGLDIAFLVVDVTKGGSSAVAAAKDQYTDGFFEFTHLDRQPTATGARQQSVDVAAALRALSNATHIRDFKYALLLEDDWLACPGSLSALVGAEATFPKNLAALRVSYGLNGVLVPRAHIASLASQIARQAGGKPPDHALTHWALKEGTLVTYRHNLFVHIGASSSIGNSGSRWNAACYELLYDFLLANVEAYQVDKCAHDMISPCGPPPRQLPHPQRRAKTFACDIALKDLNVAQTSDRLLGCLSKLAPHLGNLLPESKPL